MTDPVPPSARSLQPLVRMLADDLLARATENAEIDAGLREAFNLIERGGRTAQAFEVWRGDYLEQVAVAWVLGCIFVRFLEDNAWIEECWLAGVGDRKKLAEETHEAFFRAHPHETDREYFQHVFREVGKIDAAKDLFAEGKTPLWAVAPSGDAAMQLLAFWREIEPETGKLLRDLKAEGGRLKAESDSSFSLHPSAFSSTRFLGDLYQDLSELAKKKYALLQTPEFVEEFILDRTLTPALDEFGLEEVRLIDPTCGSGHFLLGAFGRLFRLWMQRSDNEIVAAQKALDGVWGVDINPFAVAICRFRLIVAALEACGIRRIKEAPAWKIHVATGDSLLFGDRFTQDGKKWDRDVHLDESWTPEIYACEEKDAVGEILGQQYHVVVGNPPYIIVRDRSLNAAYRQKYSTCHQKYSLAVPFAERFFDLCLADGNGRSGYCGMITANSFMKREFGKKLIEAFFPKVDLTHVIDTSGAYIPGHGTPTVILFGRNRKPTGDTVRAVLGIKGEPSTPDDPAQGLVWKAIVQHVDVPDGPNEFVSTADMPRSTYSKHPWSIGGGGAAGVKESIEDASESVLASLVASIGFASFPGLDDAFVMDEKSLHRWKVDPRVIKGFIYGETVRDWQVDLDLCALAPYDKEFNLCDLDSASSWARHLWRFRACLEGVVSFGRKTRRELAEKWWGWYRWIPDKYRTPLSIAFAEVATHNHFILDRGGRVFKQTAPIIKLHADATEQDHLALLGLLNSSTACFWLKQVCHNKGSTVDQHGARQRTDPFEDFYQHNATRVAAYPVPKEKPLDLARQLDMLGREYQTHLPDAVVAAATPTVDRLQKAKEKAEAIRGQMIALQEELDWKCYELYRLVDESFQFSVFRVRERGNPGDLPPLALGQRAFEIVMARQMAAGELTTTWFERHGSTPITEIPSHWPEAYRKLVERRIEVIETNKEIGLIEKPEYKRRWNAEPWEEQEQRALKNWLLDRLEGVFSFRFSVFREDQEAAAGADSCSSEHRTPNTPLPTTENRKLKTENSSSENRKLKTENSSPPALISTAQLADIVAADADFLQVAAIYRGRPDFDVAALVAELVEAESVPFLPVLRYKPSGLVKRAVWERTWEMQRLEDEERLKDEGGRLKEEGIQPSALSLPPSSIPVPPKYTSADFLKTDYWRLRGKLDVPKERWISYAPLSTESDPSLVVGWAGWNHLQQATALASAYDARKREGWDAKRLAPILAGLDQLIPWLYQWHPEIDPEFGESAGKSFQTLLEQDAQELGLTLEAIRAWQPPAKAARSKGGRKKKEVVVEEDAV